MQFFPSLFLSNRLYGVRPAGHRDAYRASPGWYFIEWRDWTLEVTLASAYKMPKAPRFFRPFLLASGSVAAGMAYGVTLPQTTLTEFCKTLVCKFHQFF